MVLPSSGSIGVSQIDAEFGLPNSNQRLSNDLANWINKTPGVTTNMSNFLGRANLNVDGYKHQFGSGGVQTGAPSNLYFYANGATNATIRIVINGTNPSSFYSFYLSNSVYNAPDIWWHLSQAFTGTIALQSQPGNTTGGTWVTRGTISVTNVTGVQVGAYTV